MRRVSSSVICGFLLATSACAYKPGAAADDGTAPLGARLVRLHVVNHYKEGMEIFASGSGSVQRLGLVPPGLEKDFMLPQAIVGNGSLFFLARPTAYGPRAQSERVSVMSGAVVDFEITTNLIGSQANLRP